jgi:hypothetical protein
MSTPSHGLLARLRKKRRAISLATWPALVASLLMGAACPAMSAAPAATNQHAAHHEHAAHEHHAHHASAPPVLPAGDCPHCLDGHMASNASSADCSVAAVAPASTQALPAAGVAVLVASYAPPARSAVPPLIYTPLPTHTTPSSSVPLHLRHCVLLI